MPYKYQHFATDVELDEKQHVLITEIISQMDIKKRHDVVTWRAETNEQGV